MTIKYQNIEKERIHLGMTQRQVGSLLGITTRSYINKISGITEFTGSELLKLAKLTSRTMEYLMY